MTLFLLMVACGGDQGKSADSGAVMPIPSLYDTGGPLCDDPPVLTWENFGQGFLMENCQSCHGSDAPYRDDADPSVVPPTAIVFDTHEDVIGIKNLILSSASGSEPRMPPNGGVEAADRLRLAIWLTCWEEG